jgi:type IX secretion system PorP/SprF family membrane protein
MRRVVYLIALSIGCSLAAKAQVEPHFSQYYVYPLWLNPALTGAHDGSYRASAIYRNQWSSVTTPFETIGVSADVPTSSNLNIGANILRQTAGTAGYQYMNGQVSVSYSGVRLGKAGQHVFSFALQGGVIGRRFDMSKFQGGDQWEPIIGYNPGRPVSEVLTKTSSGVLDIGTGIAYYDASEAKKVNFFGGFSAAHLTQPEDPFLSVGYKSKMPIRYTVHGGARIRLGDNAIAVPNVIYMTQGNATETVLGGYVQRSVNSTADVMAGVNYRVNDAVYPFVGLYIGGFLAAVSYDVNTSSLGQTARGAGTIELSLTYTGKKPLQKTFMKCPRI